MTRQKVGIGLLQNPDYNKGRPYFVAFRPLLHSLTRLSDDELKTIARYDKTLDEIERKLFKIGGAGFDVSEAMVELELARSKTQLGQNDVVRVYIDSLQNKLAEYEKKIEL